MPSEATRTDSELLGLAWPGGIPAKEMALLRSLPVDRAAKTLSRLAAVVSAERGGAIGKLAASVGMDRPAFFRLRARWRADRSLRSLAPFAGRKTRKAGSQALDDIAREIVRTSSADSISSFLAAALAEQAGCRVPQTQALRTVRRAKIETALELANLRRHFGRELLIDVTAVNLNAMTSVTHITPYVSAFVVEKSIGLILGHAVGTVEHSLELQATALKRSAVATVSARQSGPEMSGLEFVVGLGSSDWRRRVISELHEFGAQVVSDGERRYGQRLMSIIGHRIGRLALRPRSTGLKAQVKPQDIFPFDEAEALIAEAVFEHNSARLSRLWSELGLVHDKDPSDPVATFLDHARALQGSDLGVDMMTGAINGLINHDRLDFQQLAGNHYSSPPNLKLQ